MKTILSILGPLIADIGFLPYLKDTIKGTVKPRIASWATWTLVTGIATIAALSEGAYTSAFLTGVATITELLILIMALKNGEHAYNWLDGVSQAISIAGIVAWLLSSNAAYAIIFNIIADFFGAVPTFYHSWIAPHDESWKPFVLSGLGASISLLALNKINLVTAGFPIYLACIGYALGLNIYYRQKKLPNKSC